VFRNLYQLTDPAYAHKYFVDGTPSIIDAYFSSDTAWHTVLAAGLNKGGQSVYALDVTDPAAITEANADNVLLWEFSDQRDADLGFTFSRPAIVQMHNGKWAAVFGNGYNNTDTAGGADPYVSPLGNAALYVVDIQDGSLIKKIPIAVGAAQDPTGQARPNGLATPVVVDIDGDSKVDYAYAGDLFGNLWKFDLTDASAVNWDVAYKAGAVPLPLFVARNAANQRQPITERPTVGPGPYGAGMVVLFGTGKFLEPSDRNIGTLQAQSFYGIYDHNTGVSGTDIVTGRGSLQVQTILTEAKTTVPGETFGVRDTTKNTVDPTVKSGWYIDLISPKGFQGEMQVTDPVLRNGRVIFTTLIPDSDICAYGGKSWLMAMDAVSGSSINAFFGIVGSGISSDSIMSRPAILAGQDNDHALSTTTDGGTTEDPMPPGPGGIGRQSWRQLR
jgi:type IV pilus assembly protein PilY1